MDRTVPVPSITGSYQIGPALVTEATKTSLCISRHPFLRHYPHHKVWPMCVCQVYLTHTHTHTHSHTHSHTHYPHHKVWPMCVCQVYLTHTHTPLWAMCVCSAIPHTHTHTYLPASRDRLTYFNHHSAPRPLLTLME